MDISDVVRSSNGILDLQELLTKPPSVLLGVSAAAESALTTIGIKSVFDLGTSWLFANAEAASQAAVVGSLSSRYGLAPSDWLQADAVWTSLDEIGSLPLDSLQGIDAATALTLKTTLDVSTIRDFAFWPPRMVANGLVSDSIGGTVDPDELETEKLRPQFGEYPTERVYYSTLIMLQMQFNQERRNLDAPISLRNALDLANGFSKPAIGAQLTYSQSWYAQGITLGQMLHSLALAPGEATRIAVIDWSRRTLASASEMIGESEQLDDTTQHSRAVSEVQSAVANEFQAGGSTSSSQSSSSSGSGQASVGTGLIPSLYASADVSGSYQTANTQSAAQSNGWSLGTRSVSANMAQDVNDRTEQHATSVRNRRASAVREVSQSEHADVSTRVVANYNHMHALTVQYFEVVQVYRVQTELRKAERCLFIPVQLIDFGAADAMQDVDRYRGALVKAALTPRAVDLLVDSATAVTLQPQVPVRVAPSSAAAKSTMVNRGFLGIAAPAMNISTDTTITSPATAAPSESPTMRTWDPRIVAALSRDLGRFILRPGSDDLHLPDDAQLTALSFTGVNIKRIQLDRVAADAVDDTFDLATDSGRFVLPQPATLIDLNGILAAKSDTASGSGSMTLELSYFGRQCTPVSIPVDMATGTALQLVVQFTSDAADRQKELLAHLKANQVYYSQAIFQSLDTATIVALLSQYDWNGRPLAEQVEPKVLSVSGNYLVLRAPVELDDGSGVLNTDQAEISWGSLLDSRGIGQAPSDQRLIPIPTSGVFAEAVLGRSNSAEKLDITRFWNWQDSPIPLQPPEIAPVSTDSRATAENLQPGSLGQPVLNIVNPTSLPDPTSVSSVLGAVTNGNMFRDMSGLAGTQSLAQAAMAGTLQATTDAGQITSANMRTEAQKSVAMGQVAADLVKSLVGAGGGSSVQGISGDGAKINQGRSMDQRGVPSSSGSASAGGALAGAAAGKAASSGSPASASTAGGAVGSVVGGGGNGSSFEAAAFNAATHGIDPGTAAATVSATKPLVDAGNTGNATDANGSILDPGSFKKFVDANRLEIEIADLLRELDGYPAGSWPKQVAASAYKGLDSGNLVGILSGSSTTKLTALLPADVQADALADAQNLESGGANVEFRPFVVAGTWKSVGMIHSTAINNGVPPGAARSYLAVLLADVIASYQNVIFVQDLPTHTPTQDPSFYSDLAHTTATTPRSAASFAAAIAALHLRWRVQQDILAQATGTAAKANPDSLGFFRFALAPPGQGPWSDSDGYLAGLKAQSAAKYNEQIALWLQQVVGGHCVFHDDPAKNASVLQFFKDTYDNAKATGFQTPTVQVDGGA